MCDLGLGDDASAQRRFAEIPELLAKSKLINGRPIPMDRFVKQKLSSKRGQKQKHRERH